MDEILNAVVRGLTFGSVYALLAVGLVLTFKTAGIFNLAFGAQAFAAGAVYYEARTRHSLWIPLAVVIALVFSVLLGLACDRLLFRHLRSAPPMTRIVVTLGLLVGIPQVVRMFFDVNTSFQPQGIVPDGSESYNPFGDVFVSRDDLATAILTVLVVVALILLFRSSPLGLRMRAVVESSRLTELAGVNADRVSMISWAMSSALAGIAGVLISPMLSQVNDVYFTPLLVAAIAASVLAALSNITIAFLGGLGLGILAQVLSTELPTNSVFATNLRPSLPFVALFLVLVFAPFVRNRQEVTDPLAGIDPPPPPLAAAERSDSLTFATRLFGVVVGVAYFYWLFFHANLVWIYDTQRAVIFSVIFLSITVITGMAGQISLCQSTFAGIGALATGQLATDLGLSVLGAMVLAGLIAAAIGALVALPALRLGGIFLSLATFAFALFFDSVMVKFTWVSGGTGVTPHDVPRPTIGPIDFANEKAFLVLCIVVLAIVGVLVVWVRGGTTGRFLDALRGSETAAAAIGINATRWRITAFALSAAIAGVGGALLAMRDQEANFAAYFPAQFSVVWVVVVVSLGARTVEGAIQAGIGFVFLQAVVLDDWVPWIVNHLTPFEITSVPAGLAVALFGLGAITYARHPEGVLEHNKRVVLARLQRRLDAWRLREAPA